MRDGVLESFLYSPVRSAFTFGYGGMDVSKQEEFEKKMTMAAKHFQKVEGEHLGKMREFVEMYCKIVDDNNNQWGRVSAEEEISSMDLQIVSLTFPGPSGIPDPAGGTDGRQPDGDVRDGQVHGTGEARSVG